MSFLPFSTNSIFFPVNTECSSGVTQRTPIDSSQRGMFVESSIAPKLATSRKKSNTSSPKHEINKESVESEKDVTSAKTVVDHKVKRNKPLKRYPLRRKRQASSGSDLTGSNEEYLTAKDVTSGGTKTKR